MPHWDATALAEGNQAFCVPLQLPQMRICVIRSPATYVERFALAGKIERCSKTVSGLAEADELPALQAPAPCETMKNSVHRCSLSNVTIAVVSLILLRT